MSKSVGLCLIGAGAIAERHMQALTTLGGVTSRWVVSDCEEESRVFAGRWKVSHAGTSLEQALSDPLVEVALIASPSPCHSDQALQALLAGKDVIVEIPIAMSWQAALQVSQTAAAVGRRVWVCHTMRSLPALRLVREQVQTGRLHLTQIAGCFGIPRRRNQGMDGVGTRRWIDNLLWHHACHQIDASLWVMGMPNVARVQALLGPPHPTLGMELDAGVQLSLDDGTLVTQSLTYNTERSTWRLQFIGHEEVYTFDHGRLTNEAGVELAAESKGVDCTIQDGEILDARRSGAPSAFDLASVLPTMEVLDRAQQSAAGA